MGFKVPDFAERAALARAAKESALEKLRAKPAKDPAEVAAKIEAAAARDAAAAEKRAAKQQAIAEAKAAMTPNAPSVRQPKPPPPSR